MRIQESGENYLETILILHTRSGEDITVSLGGGFALDFVLTKKAYIEMNGLDYIDRVISTPMTTR